MKEFVPNTLAATVPPSIDRLVSPAHFLATLSEVAPRHFVAGISHDNCKFDYLAKLSQILALNPIPGVTTERYSLNGESKPEQGRLFIGSQEISRIVHDNPPVGIDLSKGIWSTRFIDDLNNKFPKDPPRSGSHTYFVAALMPLAEQILNSAQTIFGFSESDLRVATNHLLVRSTPYGDTDGTGNYDSARAASNTPRHLAEALAFTTLSYFNRAAIDARACTFALGNPIAEGMSLHIEPVFSSSKTSMILSGNNGLASGEIRIQLDQGCAVGDQSSKLTIAKGKFEELSFGQLIRSTPIKSLISKEEPNAEYFFQHAELFDQDLSAAIKNIPLGDFFRITNAVNERMGCECYIEFVVGPDGLTRIVQVAPRHIPDASLDDELYKGIISMRHEAMPGGQEIQKLIIVPPYSHPDFVLDIIRKVENQSENDSIAIMMNFSSLPKRFLSPDGGYVEHPKIHAYIFRDNSLPGMGSHNFGSLRSLGIGVYRRAQFHEGSFGALEPSMCLVITGALTLGLLGRLNERGIAANPNEMFSTHAFVTSSQSELISQLVGINTERNQIRHIDWSRALAGSNL